METEFITYEQALALKALGFDIPCFGYFDCERDFQFVPNKKNFLICEVERPTFSQSFKWFREKYQWTIKVNQVTKNNWSYTLDNFPKGRTYYGEVYKTYEEAELECLNKLIEIVESKSE